MQTSRAVPGYIHSTTIDLEVDHCASQGVQGTKAVLVGMGMSSQGFNWSLGPSTNIFLKSKQQQPRIRHPNRDQVRSKTVRGSIRRKLAVQ